MTGALHSRDDEAYSGVATYSAAQWGQTICIGYAPAQPTNLSVRRMVELLRRTADQLERGLPR
jgi:hypothetical protein